MSRILIVFMSILYHTHLDAQSLRGEYYLNGPPELASGFLFTKEGRFDFFFIYGAVDRVASGSYTIDSNILRLQSDKIPGHDFNVLLESRTGNKYSIIIQDENTLLLRNIVCLYYIDSTEYVAFSDEQGIITIDLPSVDRIYLLHELFPDIPSLIKDEKNGNNYFEVEIMNTLPQVSFQGIEFTIKENTLSCLPNYLFPYEGIEYVKKKN